MSHVHGRLAHDCNLDFHMSFFNRNLCREGATARLAERRKEVAALGGGAVGGDWFKSVFEQVWR
jgi:hypothetical protein